ncbi:MAG: Hpt domain-containing protein [Acidobacteriota bacterium]|nr:Hpt domain-containing protein [Blastocatellia bacterium]MDW8238964.1 Hpt domain-containing protein [Acidobacteriota bacterium]
MTSHVEQIFRQEMLKLRSQYIQHSLSQLQTVRSVLQRWDQPLLDMEELTQLMVIAHKLRGSGKTYDLPEVTSWAGLLESDLKTVLDNPQRLTPERRRTLLSIVTRLHSIMSAAARQDREERIES